jgi:hypothetical protein
MGCSSGGGGGSVTLPQVENPTAQSNHIGTYLWGAYQVVIDKNTHKGDIVQSRGVDQMLNVIGFMEPPPLSSMNIDWDTLVIDDANNYIGVDVILTHPINDPVFMGFDVRGVCFGPEVTNADGLTPVMNPADFANVPFGYVDGLLGTSNSIGQYDGLWGYKYFCDDLGLDEDVATFFSDEANLANRGVFRNGSQNIRHYDLSWDNSAQDFFVFNYAIYANYEWPVGEEPIDIEDFPITANSSEAFCFTATEVNNSLYYVDDTTKGGTVSIDAEVWDWQGLQSTEVTMQTTVTPDSSEAGNTSKSMIYHFVDYDPGDSLTSSDGLPLMFTVTDEKTFGEAWFLSLMDPGHPLYDTNVYAVWMYTASVSNQPPPVGLQIKISGDLPGAALPADNEKNFCVVGDNGFGRAGVYYHYTNGSANNYQIYKFPLDYSSAGTMYTNYNLGWFGWSNDQWLGTPADMGLLEVNPIGSYVLSTRSTTIMPGWWNEPIQRVIHLFGPGASTPTNGWIGPGERMVDAEDDLQAQGYHYCFWMVDAYIWTQGHIFRWGPPYDTGDYNIGGYIPWGTGNCQVDNIFQRVGIDFAAQGIAPYDAIVACLEGYAAPTRVEFFKVLSAIGAPACIYTLDNSNGLVGNAKDVSFIHNFGQQGFESALNNYLGVLEDNGDGTWQISVWEWDNPTSTLDLVARYPTPIAGTAMTLDADTTNNEVHVWVNDGGTMKYYVFNFG